MNYHLTTQRVYYAHSKLIYGTQQEVEEVEFLKKKFPEVTLICPNTTIGELNDFKDYLHVIDCCNKIIVSERNGFIGKGVFSEIARAFSLNLPVFVLRNMTDKFYLQMVIGLEVINQNDWKTNYAKLITKQ